MAAALATAQVVLEKKLGGKVVLFGTPAEGKFFRCAFHVMAEEHFGVLCSCISGHSTTCEGSR
jgi:metal-dependent amidase/aminoacylase/carboxypeptidase family protein